MPARRSRRWALAQTAAVLSVAGCSSSDDSGRATTDSASPGPSRSTEVTPQTRTGERVDATPAETATAPETATPAESPTGFQPTRLSYAESFASYSGPLIPGGVGPHSEQNEYAALYRAAADLRAVDLTTVDERDETEFVPFVEATDFTASALLLVQTRAATTPVTMSTESVATVRPDAFGVTISRSQPGPLQAVETYVLAVRIDAGELPQSGVVRIDSAGDADDIWLAVD